MLILPTDPHWQNGPPLAIERFRKFVAKHLGDAWTVALTAYDNDAPTEVDYISAEVRASHEVQGSHDEVLVSVTRHAGFDTVLVGMTGVVPPTVPFEDLAAASGWASKEEVLALAGQDLDNVEPLRPLDCALSLLGKSPNDLAAKLQDTTFRAQLQQIANEFAAGLLLAPKKPP